MTDDPVEELAKIIEPSLWMVPFCGSDEYNTRANVKGLKLCARKKAERVLEAGYVRCK